MTDPVSLALIAAGVSVFSGVVTVINTYIIHRHVIAANVAVGEAKTAMTNVHTAVTETKTAMQETRQVVSDTKTAVDETKASVVVLEKQTNSMKDDLVKASGEVEFQKGREIGRIEGKNGG